jgi:allene oxide cyclase
MQPGARQAVDARAVGRWPIRKADGPNATDNGYCIRTVPTGMTEWECTWTTLLPGGHITVEGPCYDNGTDTTLAITGGTGRYTGAEGSMLLHATGHPVGSEYNFVFALTR